MTLLAGLERLAFECAIDKGFEPRQCLREAKAYSSFSLQLILCGAANYQKCFNVVSRKLFPRVAHGSMGSNKATRRVSSCPCRRRV